MYLSVSKFERLTWLQSRRGLRPAAASSAYASIQRPVRGSLPEALRKEDFEQGSCEVKSRNQELSRYRDDE